MFERDKNKIEIDLCDADGNKLRFKQKRSHTRCDFGHEVDKLVESSKPLVPFGIFLLALTSGTIDVQSAVLPLLALLKLKRK